MFLFPSPAFRIPFPAAVTVARLCSGTWSLPPALLSYFCAAWAAWPVTEPSTVISFIGDPAASLSNELTETLNILSWFHFNRLFFLNWDGQEALPPIAALWMPRLSCWLQKQGWGESPSLSISAVLFDILEFREFRGLHMPAKEIISHMASRRFLTTTTN